MISGPHSRPHSRILEAIGCTVCAVQPTMTLKSLAPELRIRLKSACFPEELLRSSCDTHLGVGSAVRRGTATPPNKKTSPQLDSAHETLAALSTYNADMI